MIAPEEILGASILIVDDLPANVLLLETMLRGAGYRAVTSTLDPREVCQLHRTHRYDLILLDLLMPAMDGFEVMEGLKPLERDGYLPVLVITAQPDQKLRALRAGAKDFVSKPFDLAEVLTRVHNLLEVRLFARALERTVRELEASRELIRGQKEELGRLFDQVVAERKRSERLALQVSPDSIAARLQARPDVTEDAFPEVTVLVADVVGLAELAPAPGAAGPAQAIEALFGLFDELTAGRGVKKVKTLGNSYLAAAGVPVPSSEHAARAAQLALDLVQAVERYAERTGSGLQLRVGLATGPVVAGLIGRHRYLYDVWGEAVDVAARMESHGVAGRVQVSERTRGLLGAPFLLEARGALEVEGLGVQQTWFLAGPGGAGR